MSRRNKKRRGKKLRRARRPTKVRVVATTEDLADRAMRQMSAAYKRAGLNMSKPEHQAIAISATVSAAAAIAAHVDGMTAEEFGAFAEVQFERIRAAHQSAEAELSEPQS